MRDAIEKPRDMPRAGLLRWQTPLHRLDRISRATGADIWIKRDDVHGVALSGNKVRKFDFVVGKALAEGCDTLVTAGAVQSNSARAGAAAAAAAAAVGMDAVLVLSGHEPEQPYANLLLDKLLGADVRFAGDASWAGLNDEVDRVVARVNEAGAGRSRHRSAARRPSERSGSRSPTSNSLSRPKRSAWNLPQSFTPRHRAAPMQACWWAERSPE